MTSGSSSPMGEEGERDLSCQETLPSDAYPLAVETEVERKSRVMDELSEEGA